MSLRRRGSRFTQAVSPNNKDIQRYEATKLGRQHLGPCCTQVVAPNTEMFQQPKAGKVRPQRLGTCNTHALACKTKELQRGEPRKVVPQRLGTCCTQLIARKVEVLPHCEAGKVRCQRIGVCTIQMIATKDNATQSVSRRSKGTPSACIPCNTEKLVQNLEWLQRDLVVRHADVNRALDTMCCVGYMHVQRPGWGIAVCGSCSVVGLRW